MHDPTYPCFFPEDLWELVLLSAPAQRMQVKDVPDTTVLPSTVQGKISAWN